MNDAELLAAAETLADDAAEERTDEQSIIDATRACAYALVAIGREFVRLNANLEQGRNA